MLEAPYPDTYSGVGSGILIEKPEENKEMNVEEVVRDIMEHEFRYWKIAGIGMFRSTYGEVNGINGYTVDATRSGFISTNEFGLIPKGFVKPDSYMIDSVVFEDDFNIKVMVLHHFEWEYDSNERSHIEDVYTEIHITLKEEFEREEL